MEKICQSCGMPMRSEAQFGTNEDGSRNEEYCCFCFKGGKFSFEGTYDDFAQRQIKIAQEKMNMPEDKAKEMVNNTLPKLKRWRK